MNQPPTRLFIGIDPGRQTGLAVWNTAEERFDVLTTSDFWAAMDIVEAYPVDDVVVVVEDPSLIHTTFNHGTPATLDAAKRREKISRNVGMNQREARLLAEGLERKGYRVRRIRPRSGKRTADQFRRLTGYPARTSQHARDAGMLVYGLRNVPEELASKGELSLAFYAPPSRSDAGH